MKEFKKYLRGIIFAAIVFVLFFMGTGNTAAADLEQSPDEVSMEIVHEHDKRSCYTKVWIPCGGSWQNDTRDSFRVHYCTNQRSEEIVNGHSLSEIHLGDWYWGAATEEIHEGDYVNELDCDLSTIGSFAIKRTEDEEGIHLTAYTTVADANLGDYTITWDDGTVGEVNSSVTVEVDRRQTYTATLTWHDVKRDKDFTEPLSYTDISYPCSCEFFSDGVLIEEKKIQCGEKPEKMDVPEKIGYIFEGYYTDETQWIDLEGNPTSDFSIGQSDYDITLTAKWKAKTYDLKIGKEVLTFVYNEPYDDIDVEALGLKKKGYEFSGVIADGEMIFNEDGAAAGDGIWKWDMPEDAEAEVYWEKLPDPTPTPKPTAMSTPKATVTPTTVPTATPIPTPTMVPTATPTPNPTLETTPTPTPMGDATESDDDDDDGGGNHHYYDNDENGENDEDEDSVSAEEPVNTVSDDRSEATVSSDEAIINEVLQEDNDEENNQDMETAVPDGENDVRGENEESESTESADQELAHIELFYAEPDDIPDGEIKEPAEGMQPQDKGQDAEGKASSSVWVKKVMVVAAVACGVAVGSTAAVYALYAGFVYLFGMASVMNVLPDGHKKSLGRLTVADRSGGDIEINIPQNFVDNCSTGDIEITLPAIFVKKRDRKQLVVIVNEKKYLKNIKKNVELKLFT